MRKITQKRYNKIIEAIIKKNKTPDETLIEMLEAAAKYEIIEKKQIKAD